MSEKRTDMWCPYFKEMCCDGLTKTMRKNTPKGEIPKKCRFWTGLAGKHPQEDKMIDDYDCAMAWLPVLMVEQSRLQNSTGAAVESLRNRVHDGNILLDKFNNNILVSMNEKQLLDVKTHEEAKEIEHKKE